MATQISFEDVLAKIDAGNYDTKLPFPKGSSKTPEVNERRMAYRSDEIRLRGVFQADLAAANGLTDHPKAARLFEMAWERGHSSGLRDVAIEYDEMAELLR